MSIENSQWLQIHYAPDHKGTSGSSRHRRRAYPDNESDEVRKDTINAFIQEGWAVLRAQLPITDAHANQGLAGNESNQRTFTFSEELPLNSSDPITVSLAERFLYGKTSHARPSLRYLPKELPHPHYFRAIISTTSQEASATLPQLQFEIPLQLIANGEDFFTMYPCTIVLVLYFEPSQEDSNHLIAKTKILSPWQSNPSATYNESAHFWMRLILERTHLPFDLFDKSREQVSISSQGNEFIQCTDWSTLLKYYYGSVEEITEALLANGISSSQVGFVTSKEARYLFPDMQTTGDYALDAPDLHREVISRIPRCTYSKGAAEYIIERETQTVELSDRAISIPSYIFAISQPVTSNKKLIGYIIRRVQVSVEVISGDNPTRLQIVANALEDKSTRDADVRFFRRQFNIQSGLGRLFTAAQMRNPYEGGLPGLKS